MSKKQLLEIIHLASQTLPFLIIAATFIGLAYTYGHSFTPFFSEDSSQLISLSCNYLP